MLASLGQDVRYAVRLMTRQPLVTAATVLTLTLGIGLNGGVFTVINGLLFRPRVGHEPSSFVEVEVEPPLVSLQDYEAYARATSLASLTAWTPAHAESMLPLLVTCNFFDVYAPAQPIVGRVLRDADCATENGSPVAVIGEELWRSRFGADANVVGRTLPLLGHTFTVVGVLPRGYDGELRGPVWVPYTMASAFFDGRTIIREHATPWLLGMTGRLRAGVSRAAAAAELRVIAQQQDQLVPDRQTVVRVTDGSMIESPGAREQAVWVVPLVMGTVSLVLLIACLNVAVLMLSRAVARRHEIAVRISLGASRARLLQMLLTESLVVASLAAAPSLYVAWTVPRLLKALIPNLPYYPFAVDGAVLAFLSMATLLAGALAGVAPAIESLKGDVAALERRWLVGHWQPRDLLIAAQVTMSFVLLVGAAFFIRAERVFASNPGFEVDRVLAAVPRISHPPHTAATASAFYRSLEQQVRGIPGVVATSYADTVGGDERAAGAAIATAASGAPAPASVSVVTPAYFATIGLAIVRGVSFEPSSDPSAVVVSESLARTLWPDHDPIGERLRLDRAPAAPLTVVGVARDVPSLMGKPAQRVIYRSRGADAIGDALLVRFDGDEHQTADAVRAAIERLDPGASVQPRTLASIRHESADKFMRLVEMIVFLAAVALVLATIGIHGAVAFAIARRMKEIGIRVALGATTRHVVGLALWTGVKPIAAGLAIGTIASLTVAPIVARFFQNTPAHIDPFDATVYVGVGVTLATAGLAAMAAPCRRANSAEPARALHCD
jgi:predicted permease